jgi:hypothetical protein
MEVGARVGRMLSDGVIIMQTRTPLWSSMKHPNGIKPTLRKTHGERQAGVLFPTDTLFYYKLQFDLGSGGMFT